MLLNILIPSFEKSTICAAACAGPACAMLAVGVKTAAATAAPESTAFNGFFLIVGIACHRVHSCRAHAGHCVTTRSYLTTECCGDKFCEIVLFIEIGRTCFVTLMCQFTFFET